MLHWRRGSVKLWDSTPIWLEGGCILFSVESQYKEL